jgi:hypothetical protein
VDKLSAERIEATIGENTVPQKAIDEETATNRGIS